MIVHGDSFLLTGLFKHYKMGGVAIKEFIGLKPKTYSFLVDDSGEHKKESIVNKNVVAQLI